MQPTVQALPVMMLLPGSEGGLELAVEGCTSAMIPYTQPQCNQFHLFSGSANLPNHLMPNIMPARHSLYYAAGKVQAYEVVSFALCKKMQKSALELWVRVLTNLLEGYSSCPSTALAPIQTSTTPAAA